MGNYASNAELKGRFADDEEVAYLTDDPDTGTPTESVLTDVVEAAEAEINSGVAMRYLTPVDVTLDTELAALLKRKTLDLAEYYLHRRGDHASEVKSLQGERVLEWIEKIATGARVLTGAVTVASTASRGDMASWSGSGRTLNSTSKRVWTRETQTRL